MLKRVRSGNKNQIIDFHNCPADQIINIYTPERRSGNHTYMTGSFRPIWKFSQTENFEAVIATFRRSDGLWPGKNEFLHSFHWFPISQEKEKCV
jgi:hypothetical protein